MHKFLAFYCLVFLLYATSAHANNLLEPPEQDGLFIVSEQNCPYSCASSSERSYSEIEHYNNENQNERANPRTERYFDGYGYVIDIAKAIFEPLRHQTTYKTMQKKEALRKTGNGRYEMFAIISKAENQKLGAKKLVLPAHSIGSGELGFFVRTDSAWQFSGISSLSNIILATEKNASYGELEKYVTANEDKENYLVFSTGKNATDANLLKLIHGQANAVFGDVAKIKFYIKNMGLDNQIIAAGTLPKRPEDELYIGFSPKYADTKTLISKFDKGLAQIRKSGQLNEILRKYGLNDWYENKAAQHTKP